MKFRPYEARGLVYVGLLAAVFIFAFWASAEFGKQVDNYSYD